MPLIFHPWLAFIVAGALFALWTWRRTRIAAVGSLLWLGYGAYEYAMQARILCSGECDIRVDLLFLYPILLAALFAAVWDAVRRRG